MLGDAVVVLDAGSRQLLAISLRRIGGAQVLASNLPVGAAGGLAAKPLPGIPGIFPGPFVPFAGVAAGPGGRIFVAGDADGSVLALERSAS